VRGILGGEAAGTKVAIIGMRAESDDAHGLILCSSRQGQKRQCSQKAREPLWAASRF